MESLHYKSAAGEKQNGYRSESIYETKIVIYYLAPLNQIFLFDFGLNHIFRSDTPLPLGGCIGFLAKRRKSPPIQDILLI